MPKINHLQSVAFTLTPELLTTPLHFWALPFPPAWREAFQRLHMQSGRAAKDQKTFKIRSLNGAITALVNQLMAVPNQTIWPIYGRPQPPWLLAHTPIPTHTLLLIVRNWLRHAYGHCTDWTTIDERLQADDLVWEEIVLDLHQTPAPNNTAAPDTLAYTVLPVYLADQLVQREVEIRVGGETRRLLRVPIANGAELVSWPPVEHTSGKDKLSAYSYTIRIGLQTVWQLPEPRIYMHYGVRRWVMRPLLDEKVLRLGPTARTVYIHRSVPWRRTSAPDVFTPVQLKATYTDGQAVPDWTNNIVPIARQLQLDHRFPEPVDLVKHPEQWLRGKDNVVAGIVEHTPRFHPIKPGMGLDDHMELTAILRQAFEAEIDLCHRMSRVPGLRKAAHPLMKPLRALAPIQRLSALEQSIGPQITIEVLYINDATRDMLIDRIRAVLTGSLPPQVTREQYKQLESAYANGDRDALTKFLAAQASNEASASIHSVIERTDVVLNNIPDGMIKKEGKVRKVRKALNAKRAAPEPPPLVAPSPIEIDLPRGGRLRIVPQPLGPLGSLLPEPTHKLNHKERAEHFRVHTEGRAADIKRTVPHVSEPTLMLVELPNYQDSQAQGVRHNFGHRDPQRALRLGYAATGRITKFTAGGMESLRERCEKTVLDGLRRMGYLPAPIGYVAQPPHTLPTNMIVAGLHMLRVTRKRSFSNVYLPVVVFFHTQHHQVWAWMPDDKGTRTFRQALLDIATMQAQAKLPKKEDLQRAVQQFLTIDLPNEGADDVVIMAEAQNIRATFPGFQNGTLVADTIQLGKTQTPVSTKGATGRPRYIVLRSSERNETPEWYTEEGRKPGGGYSQGVWADPELPRIRYNTAGKPNSMASGRRGKQVDPSEYYAVPSLLEIMFAAGQEGDSVDAWAHAIDQWRRMGYTSNDMTLLPLPLQWAEKMDVFAEVIGPRIYPELWQDAVDGVEDDIGSTENTTNSENN